MTDWKDIATAPRNGILVKVGWQDGGRVQEWFVMKWDPTAINSLFPDVTGLWVSPDGGFTWNESDPEGAPTHWAHHLN